MPTLPITCFCLLALFAFSNRSNAQSQESLLYVGTYSERGSEGIYVFTWNPQSQSLKRVQAMGGKGSPSFLALNPNGKSLYSVNRDGVDNHPDWASVSAFSRNPATGVLQALNDESAFGAGACYVATDATGKSLFVGNYGSGDLSHYSLNDDGSLGSMLDTFQHTGNGSVAGRQDGPHVHATVVSPDNKFVYVPDLGIDQVVVYKLNPGKSLKEVSSAKVKPGTGPRHFTFHPNGKFAYLAGELNSTVVVFKKNGNGSLTELQQLSTLPPNFSGSNSVADIHAHPNGQFLYVSNRGHDTIATFKVDQKTGKLTFVKTTSTEGDWPRNFSLSPDGDFMLVANRHTDNIAIFKVDQQTGLPEFTGKSVSVPSPVCLVFK